ncbi:hypothetical protein G7A66_07200 [Altererythrobacter sp. SALINAS58]|uniref:hypothetical protein n=1 Tax=Alteripontixanthobacter muriae TaxID=2705546 RepID=UPI001575D642|nr:hypothetical protein [Alteripontixanthobacter muriae]NTZ42876.1 hypothetical protein [Alteripontixanthobacter muriae]
MKAKISIVALTIFLGACTTPADVSRPMSAASDPNAEIKIIPNAQGFDVDVSYSRYQFVPETTALLEACRSLALSRAQEEATARGRPIEPIQEQDIRVRTH